jgi:hypothetical protein
MPIHVQQGDVFKVGYIGHPHGLVLWVRGGFNGMAANYQFKYLKEVDGAAIHELIYGSWEELEEFEEMPRSGGRESRVFRIHRENQPIQFLYLLPQASPPIQAVQDLIGSALNSLNSHGVVTVAFNGIRPSSDYDVPQMAAAMVKAGAKWLEAQPNAAIKDIWFVDQKGSFNPYGMDHGIV